MASNHQNERLSQISTRWSMLLQAHCGSAPEASAAFQVLMQRYGRAVYRYLLGAVRDPEVADDLAQEFALRFLRGGFQGADPERGRFRDYLKTALIHLVDDFHRARQAWPGPLLHPGPEPAAPAAGETDSERAFLDCWREELLERTWQALAEDNPSYHAVLLFRIENPDASSAQMAEQLGTRLEKPLTAAWVRKTLQRAHGKFADLLLDEVAASLEAPTPETLRRELKELDLLKYCQEALDKRPWNGDEKEEKGV
jgi:RNA polymerase sigma-70 factor (ECF subfamily)